MPGSSRPRSRTLPLVLASLGVALVLAAALATAQPAVDPVHHRHLRVPSPYGEQHVVVMYPRLPHAREFPSDRRWPIVVALHGQGEARRGPERGPMGWSTDYQLPAAFAALARGRVTTADYGGFVRADHLAAVNRRLARRAFGGVVVVCPYTPDLMPEAPGSERILEYASWVAGPLLEQVRAAIPGAARGRDATGIDGVSLGGMVALEVGLRHPEAFGAVGAIQPAIRGREEAIAALAGGTQQMRLLTSDGDPFRGPTERLSGLLRARHAAHDLEIVPGPHDYAFNRGPGSLELLLFHDRALAAEPLEPAPAPAIP